MRKILFAVVLAVCVVSIASNVFAYSWTFNGDTNGTSPEGATGVITGYTNVSSGEILESSTQPVQISGMGTLLPIGYSQFLVNFDANVNSWDAYNAPSNPGGGYYDVFAVVLSEGGYYWNLANTSTHPLENNPLLVLGDDPYFPGIDKSYWGGTSDSDGILNSSNDDVNVLFNTDPTKQYYLSLFMQTMQDEQMVSWGTFSNLNVQAGVVPEPATMALFALGLTGVGILRKRRTCKASSVGHRS